jgi:hypothetical protein
MMEQLKNMKCTLMNQVQAQLCNLQAVDAKELGEVVDMIKDLEETMYYCTIIEAMEGKGKENYNNHYAYYTDHPYYMDREMEKRNGRMYYPDHGESGKMGPNDHMRRYDGQMAQYSEREMPVEFRDAREGRSPTSRRMYMESKELNHDKAKKMKELEKYMQELTLDIAEMIEDSSPEEKQLLHKKITALASKIETL